MTSRTARDIPKEEWKRYKPFRYIESFSEEKMRAQAMDISKRLALELVKQFGAVRVVLFGSLSQQQFGYWSDIDIAVWGIPDDKFYRAVAFASSFSDQWKIDLVDAEDCNDSLMKCIQQQSIVL